MGEERNRNPIKIMFGIVKGLISDLDKERIKVQVSKQLTVEIRPKFGGSPGVDVTCFMGGEKRDSMTLPADEMCRIFYKYEFCEEIEEPEFPVKLTYKGKEYFLNKTSGNKLILTK